MGRSLDRMGESWSPQAVKEEGEGEDVGGSTLADPNIVAKPKFKPSKVVVPLSRFVLTPCETRFVLVPT